MAPKFSNTTFLGCSIPVLTREFKIGFGENPAHNITAAIDLFEFCIRVQQKTTTPQPDGSHRVLDVNFTVHINLPAPATTDLKAQESMTGPVDVEALAKEEDKET